MWDPAGEKIIAEQFTAELQSLKQKLQQYQANPKIIQKKRKFFLRVGFIFLIIACSVIVFLSIILKDPEILKISYIGLLGFGPLLIQYKEVRDLERDLLNILIAEKQGWLYDPHIDYQRAKSLAKKLPKAFKIGNSGTQHLENQFWGHAQFKGESVQFWSGIFSFTMGSGKSKQSYRHEVIAFHMPRHISHTILIKPQSSGSLFKKDIQTEWHEFNKTFFIECWTKDGRGEKEAIQTLSPAVQERIMDLKKKRGNFIMVIEDDVCAVRFLRKRVHPMQKTNFFKSVELDPRDLEEFLQEINELVELNGEVLRFLD